MKSNKILLIIVSTLLFMSCSDTFLDKYKLGALSTASFFQTEGDAFQSVVAAYSDLKDYRYDRTIWYFGDVLSDDATMGGSAADTQGSALMESYNYDASYYFVANRWQICYRGITKANEAIDGITAMDDAIFKTQNKQQLLGEALFLRAFYYHELVKAYGDVPLLTHTATIADKTMTRTPAAKVYAQIEKDLTDAASMLPSRADVNWSNYAGRATKGAANAMLSRVYLFDKKYAECKIACEAVFNDAFHYDLLPNYADEFTLANEDSKESLFEIEFWSSPLGASGGTLTSIGNGMVTYSMPDNVGGWACNIPRVDLAKAFISEGDSIRKHACLLTTDTLKAIENMGKDYVQPSLNPTGYFNKKYYLGPKERNPYAKTVWSAEPTNVRVLRLSEVYLNYAEALANIGGNDATAQIYLNKVRTRVHLLPKNHSGATLLSDILLERRLEFAGEGHRFWDVVRTGNAVTEFSDKGTFNPTKNSLLPIPLAEITASNGTITQNPM
jgi:hypothetical protein